ncbi:MAG: pilus assembly protein PilP [Arenicellales bacterium]
MFIAIVLLQACADEANVDDLKSFTEKVRNSEKPDVEPLPTIQITESFEYAAADIDSPFDATNVLPERQASLEIDPVLPDQDRLRQPLEYYPLDSLKMLGTLKQNNIMHAIISTPDSTVERVTIGNFAGMQLGEIIEVREAEVVLEETFRLKNGGWEKRKVSVAITE